MKKPEKKKYPKGIGAWKPKNKEKILGYNQAIDDYEVYHNYVLRALELLKPNVIYDTLEKMIKEKK